MSAQSNGLVAAAKQNEAGGATPHNVSTFPLSYSFFNSERFGELAPFFVEEGVSGDRLPLHNSHQLRTFTLEAPLMQSLLKKKDFFYVPMQAILPLNWEKFYTNPVIGEDVPDDVGCGVVDFWDKVGTLFKNSFDFLDDQSFQIDTITAEFLTNVFKFLVFFEYFYSTGSLMKCLGISGQDYCMGVKISASGDSEDNTDCSYDDLFDAVVSTLVSNDVRFICSIDGTQYNVSTDPATSGLVGGGFDIGYREFLERLRDGLATFSISSVSGVSSSLLLAVKRVFGFSGVQPTAGYPTFFITALDATHVPLNLSRLWAYQLICAHFYSNDHVDFVYSAELFRQYIWQLFKSFADSQGEGLIDYTGFTVNGFIYQYDALSSFVCRYLLVSSVNIFSFDVNQFAYFTALFHYKRSLRYMDYFTGARSRPLAIGDASVDVADSKVDVLDLSRSRMMAKFLQAVNRSGRKFGAYMKELFGKVPAPDYHNPFYLAHTSDVVGSSENQNTGADQRAANAFTSNMITNASRYAFMFHPDRDCVVIGITYYDIPRVYTRATERQNFFLDRFDMFNPYLQFVGDQPIYKAEIGTLDPSVDSADPFGYQNRHMEYKQRFNQAAGAFANPSTNLGNWIFVADLLQRKQLSHISSSFIRSFNSELDHFYTSLTGWSNGSYFHFLCRYDNRQDATRPMAYAPVIA